LSEPFKLIWEFSTCRPACAKSGPAVQGLGDQVVHGLHRFSFGNRYGVCGDDMRCSDGRIRQAAASDRCFDDQLLLLNQTLS
jgi:hypothetical protein